MTIGSAPTLLKYEILNSFPMVNAMNPRAISEMMSSSVITVLGMSPTQQQTGYKVSGHVWQLDKLCDPAEKHTSAYHQSEVDVNIHDYSIIPSQ